MTAQSNDLAVHLARQVKSNPKLAYLIGPYTHTWDLMVMAIGSITGEDAGVVDARFRNEMVAARPLGDTPS